MSLNCNQHWAVFVVAAVCCLTGCQQGKYSAATLPFELQAPPVQSIDRIDLSRLSQTNGAGEVIRPGDVLDVVIATGYEKKEPTTYSLRVADNGSATVPLIGPVRIAGMSPAGAENAIRTEGIRRDIYRKPQVSVQWSSRQSHHVTVTGAVKKPGVYELPVGRSDLLAALVVAEGLSEDADTNVEIRHPATPSDRYGLDGSSVEQANYQPDGRNRPRTVHVDLVKATSGDVGDLRLEDGSVVVVRKKTSRSIYVMGLVKQAGQFDMPPDQDLRLLDALALAQGRTIEIADKISIIRNNPYGPEPITIAASVREAKRNRVANIRLAPGDVISVEETPTTFVVESVRNLLRFGFTAGIPGI